MTHDYKAALEALENWVRDPERMIVPYGQLTPCEIALCDAVEASRAALKAQEWQPEETAPKGVPVLIAGGVGMKKTR